MPSALSIDVCASIIFLVLSGVILYAIRRIRNAMEIIYTKCTERVLAYAYKTTGSAKSVMFKFQTKFGDTITVERECKIYTNGVPKQIYIFYDPTNPTEVYIPAGGNNSTLNALCCVATICAICAGVFAILGLVLLNTTV